MGGDRGGVGRAGRGAGRRRRRRSSTPTTPSSPAYAGRTSRPGRDVRPRRRTPTSAREDVALGADGRASFTLATPATERAPVELAVPGEHMVSNALAAAAAGVDARGVARRVRRRALAGRACRRWRMETFTTPDGVRVVNDAYNANPESMAAALRAARWMAGEAAPDRGARARWRSSARSRLEEHERIGELAARIRVDRLITVGASAPARSPSPALREGVEPDNVASYDDAGCRRSTTCARSRAPRRRGPVQGIARRRARADGGGACGEVRSWSPPRSRSPSRCSARPIAIRRSASGDGVSGSARTARTPTWRRWARPRWAAS